MPLSIGMNRRLFLFSTAALGISGRVESASARSEPADDTPVYPLRRHPDSWDEFKRYDPHADPDAIYFRSTVQRALRVASRASFQAHPGLSPQVSGGSLVAAYLTLDGSDVDLNRTRYMSHTAHIAHVERAWTYLDVVVGWNSTGLVPNPALTDAAHRNGLKCLGTIFQPDKRMFDDSDLSRAEVAERLVNLAEFFGFDGYFVNFEGHDEPDARCIHDLIEAMKVLAEQRGLSDFYIQFYNGYTNIDAVWPGPPHANGSARERGEARADSMMLDQGWSNYGLTHGCCSGPALTTLASAANEPDYPGIGSVYYGLQLYPGPGYFSLAAPRVVTPNGGPAFGSLQIYSVDDGLRKMRAARLNTLKAKATLLPQEQAEYASFTAPSQRRNAWYNLHRRFWSGQTGNPAADNLPSPEQLAIYGPAEAKKIYTDYDGAQIRDTDQMRLPISYGVANFITERSAITQLPFVCHFNTGEGDRFWVDGRQVAKDGWFNLGIQDLLPTWMWWIRKLDGRAGDTSLSVDFDYTRAFDGGTSLIMRGTLAAGDAEEVRLFRTDIDLPVGTVLDLVYQEDQPAQGRLSVGLSFLDAPDRVTWIEVTGGTPLQSGWRQARLDLSDFHHRTLCALSLGFTAPEHHEAACHITLGRIALTTGTSPVHAPEGARIERARISLDRRSASLGLVWTASDEARHYDIFSRHADSLRVWQGRISGNAYFIDALERYASETITHLEIVPTGHDSMPGAPASLVFHWS